MHLGSWSVGLNEGSRGRSRKLAIIFVANPFQFFYTTTTTTATFDLSPNSEYYSLIDILITTYHITGAP